MGYAIAFVAGVIVAGVIIGMLSICLWAMCVAAGRDDEREGRK